MFGKGKTRETYLISPWTFPLCPKENEKFTEDNLIQSHTHTLTPTSSWNIFSSSSPIVKFRESSFSPLFASLFNRWPSPLLFSNSSTNDSLSISPTSSTISSSSSASSFTIKSSVSKLSSPDASNMNESSPLVLSDFWLELSRFFGEPVSRKNIWSSGSTFSSIRAWKVFFLNFCLISA